MVRNNPKEVAETEGEEATDTQESEIIGAQQQESKILGVLDQSKKCVILDGLEEMASHFALTLKEIDAVEFQQVCEQKTLLQVIDSCQLI